VIHLNSTDCGEHGAHVDRHSQFSLKIRRVTDLTAERIAFVIHQDVPVIMETNAEICENDFEYLRENFLPSKRF